jgi:hypothetical protein
MKDDEKNALIEHRIARGTDTIEEVSFLIKNKKFLLAVNRIYYGMFYIISALSLRYDFSTSKYQQLIGWFNKEFISTGEIDRKYGRILHNAYNNRSTGDYDDFAEFDEEDVKKSFDEMKDFIRTIRALLQTSLGEEMAGYAGQSNKKTFYRIAETKRGIQRQ